MPEKPDKLRSVEYLQYLADSHPGKYDQDIKACCSWAANRITHTEHSLECVVDAVKAAGHDFCPCRLCGCVVLAIPTGITLCPTCAKKEATEA